MTIKKKKEIQFDDDYLDCTFPETDAEFAEFEKTIIKGLEIGLWDKETLEFNIARGKFQIELSKLNEKDREKRIEEARKTNEFDCYLMNVVGEDYFQLDSEEILTQQKRIEVLQKILRGLRA